VVSPPSDSEPELGPGPDDPRSRRQLLAGSGAAALGAAALLSGCGSSAPPANRIRIDKHSPEARRDIRLLNHLLDLEYHAIEAYTASVPILAAANRQQPSTHKKPAASQPASAGSTQKHRPLSTEPLLSSNAAALFLAQEIDHSLELKAIIKQAGGKPASPAPSYDLGGDVSSKNDVLLVLHKLEQAQLTAYLEAITLLTPGQLRAAAAAIFSNEAQHAMVLRMGLGLPAIPSPFVTGRE
jgi:Ferritin-like domain